MQLVINNPDNLKALLKQVAQSDQSALAQDTFMIIWKNREKLENMTNFPGYLYVITRNKALKAFRELLEKMEQPPDDAIQTLLEEPGSAVEYKDLQRILHQGIDLMPNRRKEVFKLSRIEQLSYKEIAGRLNISTNAVKLHIVEALIFLRTFMKEHTDILISWLLLVIIHHL